LRTLNQEAAIYIFDEPLNHIDIMLQNKVSAMIADTLADKLTIVISHGAFNGTKELEF
jgi:ABC-type transport system involved in cytochrome bd biosynthesis fused ATPase/permease subunit